MLSVGNCDDEVDNSGGNQDLDQVVVKLLQHQLVEGSAHVHWQFIAPIHGPALQAVDVQLEFSPNDGLEWCIK